MNTNTKTNDIRNKTLAEFIADTGNAQHTATWQGWKQTFYMGFWQLFGERITSSSLKLDSLRCADVLDTCEQIKAVNLVVDTYLTENYASSAGQETQKLSRAV
jgi:hypothetical protein